MSMDFNKATNEFKSCPFCGCKQIRGYAFSFSPDCGVECENCGAGIGSSVPWGDMDEKEHDKACYEHMLKLWNTRSNEGK